MLLLQIYHWVCWWKFFENWLTFREVTGKSLVSCFFNSESRTSKHNRATVLKAPRHTQPSCSMEDELTYRTESISVHYVSWNLVNYWYCTNVQRISLTNQYQYHSRTMSPLDRAWKPGFSPDTSAFSTLETFMIIALYKSTFTIPYHTKGLQ